MIKIKQTSADAASTDLGVNLLSLTKTPLYYLEDTFVNDVLVEEEDSIDNNFTNSLYDSDSDNRFTDVVNARLLYYSYKIRLIHDDVNKNYILTFNPDYVPLKNTANRSTTMYKLDLAGRKQLNKGYNGHSTYEQLSYDLLGGEDNDVAIAKPDTTSDDGVKTTDFKLLRLNLRGILNPFRTRIRKTKDNSDVANYVDTNEIYMLKMDKKKLFGDNTNIHIHQILPKTLNKHSIDYIGKISDVDYVYMPIEF